ncbi:hypothetical protein BDV96DRAFT_604303 [Lophiotrema nucula]|uniref:FAD dependent oxidoreductase domain-containing protein n=1 Tax=Lophiotrema nucula TaxID=690887 RepID=A0A6A5YTD8_9PLEO|nr:hypothetical protein BDV96DRAFT_604303 [Lophiotrema nucula]
MQIKVKKLVYNDNGRCIGAIGNNDQAHLTGIVILCTGANTRALIEGKEEIVARLHCVDVVQLTLAEVEKYSGLPIMDDFEQFDSPLLGVCIFFPLDKSGLLKLCSCRFIAHYYDPPVPGASLSHSHEDQAEDGVPRQIETEMRNFVRGTLPESGHRQECTGMAIPRTSKSASFMSVVGEYVADLGEGKLDKDYKDLWKWCFGQVPPKTGNEPHPYPQRDLGELDGWKGRNRRTVSLFTPNLSKL